MMSATFHKFPHTPHLTWLGRSVPRADKVMDDSESSSLLNGAITVEEKVDGANIGLGVENGQIIAWNRGTVLTAGTHPQFQPLWPWLSERWQSLQLCLGEDLLVYGEWCFAVHSIHYDKLPDWFLGFDVYDRSAKRFYSAERRDEWLESAGLERVPRVAAGRFTLTQLTRMLDSTTSTLTTGPVEGFYVRRDQGGWLQARAKLVRSEFVQSIEEHWSSRPMEKNRLAC